jgi:SAM-dependent methyltransferase
MHATDQVEHPSSTAGTSTTSQESAFTHTNVLKQLYLGIMGRDADEGGLDTYRNALRNGMPLSDIVVQLLSSPEYKSNHQLQIAPSVALPDLTKIYAEKYARSEGNGWIFKASSDSDFRLMESLIRKHRYYESLGAWTPVIDLDKRVTASIVKGLGAKTCLELGCFSGAVLTLLADQGIDVCGVEVSHLAFVLAYSNVHERIRFGDLLDIQLPGQFDVFLGMDILEHLSPLDLVRYIDRIAGLVNHDGFAYVNSPMFGTDDVFGTPFPAYLPEWLEEGKAVFWRHMHCDTAGWPMHGHLVWASPQWWEAMFADRGLVRDRIIEAAIHASLNTFFDKIAPARQSLFVLRHADFKPDHRHICIELASRIGQVVCDIE